MTTLLHPPVLRSKFGPSVATVADFLGRKLAISACLVRLVSLIASGKAARPMYKGFTMNEASTSEGGIPKRVIFLVYDLEEAESGPTGAVDVGKMDSKQYRDFRQECVRLCKGQYRVGFHDDPVESLSSFDEFYLG